jgi:hypothetical protein
MELKLVCKGTPEEIAAIIEAVQAAKVAQTTIQQSDQREAPDEPPKFVSVEIMHRALTRRPLTENTRVMLMTLCEAEEAERYVSRSTLCEATGLTLAQLNGVLGKFGARIIGTNGYDGTSSYLEYGRNELTGEGTYRLPEALREVVREVLEVTDIR